MLRVTPFLAWGKLWLQASGWAYFTYNVCSLSFYMVQSLLGFYQYMYMFTVTFTVGANFTYKDLCSNQWPQYYPGWDRKCCPHPVWDNSTLIISEQSDPGTTPLSYTPCLDTCSSSQRVQAQSQASGFRLQAYLSFWKTEAQTAYPALNCMYICVCTHPCVVQSSQVDDLSKEQLKSGD